MKRIAMIMGLLCLLCPLAACEREAPPKPIGSSTNKHFEESSASSSNAGGALSDMKSSLEKAQHTEPTLQGAAGSQRQQAEHATP